MSVAARGIRRSLCGNWHEQSGMAFIEYIFDVIMLDVFEMILLQIAWITN